MINNDLFYLGSICSDYQYDSEGKNKNKGITYINLKISKFACSKNWVVLLDEDGYLYIYDDNNLYKINIETKFQAISALNDNIYALTCENPYLFEFRPPVEYKKAFLKIINNFNLSVYSISSNFSLKLITKPYYVDNLFVVIKCQLKDVEYLKHTKVFHLMMESNVKMDKNLLTNKNNNTSNINLSPKMNHIRQNSPSTHNNSYSNLVSSSNIIEKMNNSEKNTEINKYFNKLYPENSNRKNLNKNTSDNKLSSQERITRISSLLGKIFETKIEDICNRVGNRSYSKNKANIKKIPLERVEKRDKIKRECINLSFENNHELNKNKMKNIKKALIFQKENDNLNSSYNIINRDIGSQTPNEENKDFSNMDEFIKPINRKHCESSYNNSSYHIPMSKNNSMIYNNESEYEDNNQENKEFFKYTFLNAEINSIPHKKKVLYSNINSNRLAYQEEENEYVSSKTNKNESNLDLDFELIEKNIFLEKEKEKEYYISSKVVDIIIENNINKEIFKQDKLLICFNDAIDIIDNKKLENVELEQLLSVNNSVFLRESALGGTIKPIDTLDTIKKSCISQASNFSFRAHEKQNSNTFSNSNSNIEIVNKKHNTLNKAYDDLEKCKEKVDTRFLDNPYKIQNIEPFTLSVSFRKESPSSFFHLDPPLSAINCQNSFKLINCNEDLCPDSIELIKEQPVYRKPIKILPKRNEDINYSNSKNLNSIPEINIENLLDSLEIEPCSTMEKKHIIKKLKNPKHKIFQNKTCDLELNTQDNIDLNDMKFINKYKKNSTKQSSQIQLLGNNNTSDLDIANYYNSNVNNNYFNENTEISSNIGMSECELTKNIENNSLYNSSSFNENSELENKINRIKQKKIEENFESIFNKINSDKYKKFANFTIVDKFAYKRLQSGNFSPPKVILF